MYPISCVFISRCQTETDNSIQTAVVMVMSLLKCLLLFYFSFNELTTAAEAILWVKTGEKFTMKCSTTLKDQDGMYLYVGLDREVLYYYQRDSKLTPRKGYWDRVKTEGPVDQLTIIVSNLTIQDTGVYWCVYTKFNETTSENDINQGRDSTLVVVNDDAPQLPCPTATAVTLTPFHPANEKPCPSGMVNIIIIIIITSLLTILLCAIFLICLPPRVKRCCNQG
ncbi:uncharacterized protein LOC115178051 isoform X2 [Salmo trutta]|uniref:uncharacterized protein LOC115177847 isoform X1 n=1 Tax=Salmo trutta TaxID=8032 RepID=UPI0011315FD3|nr:uncharacterized protein LOC115177847 isoform X1 [Salmo trutta]XP_029594700.1 uncharacterized protein LOC115177847 isoform X2 [Salmo trutta]XP_029594934.1 uncharacterized protein LOC115178051 isoform X1 [Salmo trutta]XP_029594935.1 uncharacterized protein LOC115178051 isoform X2 [Salmo trutta]